MITKHQTNITKDLTNKKLRVVREFDAPIHQVWQAWTESHLLDQWWAPKPWKAQTKTMDFREGGHWLYAMVGPDGAQTWCRADYKTIDPEKGFTVVDAFCDENGKATTDFPSMHWKNEFFQTPAGTRVEVEITFSSEADLEKIIEMGFKEGFTAALTNLDELLQPATTKIGE
jgi:uncharacterized protein YndB with AHSA1/START domain